MKRIVVATALAVLMASPMVHAADRIKLNVWIGHKSWVPYVEDFNRVQDKYEAVYTINGSTDALMAAVAAGNPPDIFRAGSDGVLGLAAKGAIEPLDTFIQRDKLDLSGFIPGVLAQTQWHGHTWALPVNADGFMLYYNQDLMSASGLDPQAPPKTWDQLEAQSRKITKFDAAGVIQQLGYPWEYDVQSTMLNMFQKNISILSGDLKTVGYDNDGMKAMLTRFLSDLDEINGGRAATEAFRKAVVGDNGFNVLFAAGKLGFYTGHQETELKTQTASPNMAWNIIAPPVPDGGIRTNISGGHRVTIPKGAKNVEGAWAFIKWITSKEAGLAFAVPGFSRQFVAEDYQGIGQSASARVDVDVTAPFFKTPLWAPFVQETVYAAAYPKSPNSNMAWTELSKLFPDIMDHKLSPSEAVDQAAATANVKLAEAIAQQEQVMAQFK